MPEAKIGIYVGVKINIERKQQAEDRSLDAGRSRQRRRGRAALQAAGFELGSSPRQRWKGRAGAGDTEPVIEQQGHHTRPAVS